MIILHFHCNQILSIFFIVQLFVYFPIIIFIYSILCILFDILTKLILQHPHIYFLFWIVFIFTHFQIECLHRQLVNQVFLLMQQGHTVGNCLSQPHNETLDHTPVGVYPLLFSYRTTTEFYLIRLLNNE